MVSLDKVAAKVAKGFGKAAQALGETHAVIRPNGAFGIITSPPLMSIQANFDSTPAFALLAPGRVGQPIRYGLFDTTGIEEGDYLVGTRTYFVSQLEPAQAPLCVKCDRVFSVYNPQGAVQKDGRRPYGGRTAASDQLVASGWPGSCLLSTRGEIPAAKLPTDVRAAAFYQIMLPPSLWVALSPAWGLTDDLGTEYNITGAQRTSYGWQVLAQVSTA